MNKKELFLIWCNYNGLNFSKLEKILANFNDFEEIFDKNNTQNAFFDESINSIIQNLQNEDMKNFEQVVTREMERYNVKPVTYWSEEYPDKLKVISDPPLVIYTKGDVSLLKKKSISIVGTRKPTMYGKIVCENFTKELSSAGLVTISGLAYGIDTIVAEKTLEAGGKTIAVLAGGLDSIYPAQNTSLAGRILETGGLLVSEYKIGTKPVNYQFISRNRIVSALGLGTLIVEAGKSSGTMTTANFALEQSRELFAIPGNINSSQSEGTNSLIDQMPDIFTISPERILYKLNIRKKSAPKSEVQIEMGENKIIELLSTGEKTFDELCDGTGMSASELSTKLIKMEMFGMVKKGPSNTYYKM